MAASAGTVTLDLDANSVKLIRELQRAQKQTKRSAYAMRRDMKDAFAKMGRAAAGFGVAMVAASKVSIDFADKIGKTAKATGLTAEAFQELAFAAKRSGVEQSLFSSSMVAFVKRVGEAQAGMGPLVSGLKNLDAELLKNIVNARDQSEALRILAEGVRNADSATEKAAITNAAFGRSGVVMVNMLQDGADGLDTFARKARSLGVVMSNDLVANAEDAADKMGDLQAVFKVSIAQAVLENADSIIALTQALIDFVGIVGRAARGWDLWKTSQEEGLSNAVEGQVRMNELVLQRQRLEAMLADLESGHPARMNRWAQSAEEVRAKLEAIKNQQLELQESAKERIVGDAKAAEIPAAVGGGGIDEISVDNSDLKERLRLTQEYITLRLEYARDRAVSQFEENAEWLNEQLEARNLLEGEYLALLDRVKTPTERHLEAINRVAELYDMGVIPTVEEYARILNGLTEQFDGHQQQIEKATSQFEEFGLQAARNLQDAFADFLFDPFEEGLDGMLKGFAETLRRMAAEAAAAAILNAVMGGLSGSDNQFLASIGAAFGGGKAMGGSVSRGTAYLVGERGPEIFVPQGSGEIVPNDQLRGGSGIVNVFNFQKDPRRKSLEQEAYAINRLQERAKSRNR